MIYRFVNGVIKDIKETINDNDYLIFEDYD